MGNQGKAGGIAPPAIKQPPKPDATDMAGKRIVHVSSVAPLASIVKLRNGSEYPKADVAMEFRNLRKLYKTTLPSTFLGLINCARGTGYKGEVTGKKRLIREGWIGIDGSMMPIHKDIVLSSTENSTDETISFVSPLSPMTSRTSLEAALTSRFMREAWQAIADNAILREAALNDSLTVVQYLQATGSSKYDVYKAQKMNTIFEQLVIQSVLVADYSRKSGPHLYGVHNNYRRLLQALEKASPPKPAGTDMAVPQGPVPQPIPAMALAAIHSQHMRLVETEPVPSDKRIILSANIFRPKDGNSMEDSIEATGNRQVLETILNKANILILEPEEIRKQIVRNGINRNNLTIVMTDEDYRSNNILNNSDKANWTKSGLLILQDRLIKENYLYLEGIIGLAKAMMRDDEFAMRDFYSLLTGQELTSEMVEAVQKNPIAFAVNAMLKFKPITSKDVTELDALRRMMEKNLIAA